MGISCFIHVNISLEDKPYLLLIHLSLCKKLSGLSTNLVVNKKSHCILLYVNNTY